VVDKVYFCESKKVTEDEKIDDSDLHFGWFFYFLRI
jgi:hypothetical protein